MSHRPAPTHLVLALGAPGRCGEPVRASWLVWFGSALFSNLVSNLAARSGHSLLLNTHLGLLLDTLKSHAATLLSSDFGRNDLGKATNDGLGGTEPAYQPETLIQERPMDSTIGRTLIQRIIQSGQRRTILALS
jgi:hypothetical protein